MSSSLQLHEMQSSIRSPRARVRQVARWLMALSPIPNLGRPTAETIKVICISDTHNHQPDLPDGDLLIHAGDMTEWGSFDEIQRHLDWMSAQPHPHKVVVAGNHDVLFDSTFLESHTQRFPTESGKTAADLNFGNIVYLQDSSITLDFPQREGRRCKIYGSPRTPRYGDSAFQYDREVDVWTDTIPRDVDILITHGPPFNYLDGPRRSGCPYLASEVEVVRPRLVVCGHIHVGRGTSIVRLNTMQTLYQDVERGWREWDAIPLMAYCLLWERFSLLWRKRRHDHCTEFVNAAVVGSDNQLVHEATVAHV